MSDSKILLKDGSTQKKGGEIVRRCLERRNEENIKRTDGEKEEIEYG